MRRLTLSGVAMPHRGIRALLVLLVLVGIGCADASLTSDVEPEPELEPEPIRTQLTLGTPQHDEATAVAIRGSVVYVTGITSGSLDGPNKGSTDVFVRKYHPEGDVLWRDQFGTHVGDRATGIAADNAGNAYVVGWTEGSLAGSRGNVDALIRKYNTNGKIVWTRQFGTEFYDIATSVTVDGNGNIYVAGITYGSMQGSHKGGGDIFVRKYSSGGNVLWTRQFGTDTADGGTGVAAEAGGSVFVVGYTLGSLQGASAGGYDVVIRKFSSGGGTAWTRQFGTAGLDTAWGVATDGSGAVLIAGETSGSLQGSNAGGSDAFVRKYLSSGAVVATRQFGTSSIDIASAVAADGADNYYLTGLTGGNLTAGNSAGSLDAFVLKFSSNDAHQWTTQFGTASEDRGIAVAAGSGASYTAGRTAGSLVGANSGGFDAFLRRLDNGGQTEWTDQ